MAAVTTTDHDKTPGGTMEANAVVEAVVERIHDGLATVLIGPEAEEWDFPSHLLPDEAVEGSLLILEASGRNFRVIGIGTNHDDVEERLSRSLNRRKRIVFPLPHREIPVPVGDASPTDRPSRLTRGLGAP